MKIMLVSLHFGPGHIAHLEAWNRLISLAGYKVAMFLDEKYLQYISCKKYNIYTKRGEIQLYKPDIVVLFNFGTQNVKFVNWCKKNNIKVIYILHEPYMGIKELVKDGSYIVKQTVACAMNNIICKNSTKVVLCSDYALQNCKRFMKSAYEKSVRFPLIFLDLYDPLCTEERKYFSLIGTYATSKGSDLFLKFIKQSFERDYDINFQIATRSNIEEKLNDEIFKKLIAQKKLIVYQGHPLTTNQINSAYRRSICCWNGYRRTTQSGVLPNAFMQGTPVVATKLGSFKEFVIPDKTGEFINNQDVESIYTAYSKIKKNITSMSETCREEFINNFFCDNQVKKIKEILESII